MIKTEQYFETAEQNLDAFMCRLDHEDFNLLEFEEQEYVKKLLNIIFHRFDYYSRISILEDLVSDMTDGNYEIKFKD